MKTRVRIIGRGRVGGSLGAALLRVGGYEVDYVLRGEDVGDACAGVDAVVIATPDAVIGTVAAAIEPSPSCVVVHLAGSLGLEVLTPHQATASMHPLISLPDQTLGADRLLDNAWFATSGDEFAAQLARDLGGRPFPVADSDRVLYHATAVVASNHLVALFGQVERLAEACGVPFEAFLPLAFGALQSVAELGPTAALTGPAARGDTATIERHILALPEQERSAYEAMLLQARKLVS